MRFTICILLLMVSISGCGGLNDADGKVATIYKSPTCGCCVGYAAELERQGFEVETVSVDDLDSIKQQHQIPKDMESCHTTVIDNYFIEGHVPLPAVRKLLQEKPAIEGIALPDMPSGTPGMPGPKRGPYKVYALSNGNISDFITI